MVLSSVYLSEEIDNMILEIAENKGTIKGLIASKNKLMHNIDKLMRQRAKRGDMLCETQMLDYRDFSEFYEEESAILTSYIARLKKKMGHGRLRQEILKPRADLMTLHKGLEAIVTLQERTIAVLSGMVNMAEQTLNVLTETKSP